MKNTRVFFTATPKIKVYLNDIHRVVISTIFASKDSKEGDDANSFSSCCLYECILGYPSLPGRVHGQVMEGMMSPKVRLGGLDRS